MLIVVFSGILRVEMLCVAFMSVCAVVFVFIIGWCVGRVRCIYLSCVLSEWCFIGVWGWVGWGSRLLLGYVSISLLYVVTTTISWTIYFRGCRLCVVLFYSVISFSC